MSEIGKKKRGRWRGFAVPRSVCLALHFDGLGRGDVVGELPEALVHLRGLLRGLLLGLAELRELVLEPLDLCGHLLRLALVLLGARQQLLELFLQRAALLRILFALLACVHTP